MNANRARPLVAFWLLALAAAVIAVLGLRAGAGAEVRTDTPTQQVEPSAHAPAVASVLLPGTGHAAPPEHPAARH